MALHSGYAEAPCKFTKMLKSPLFYLQKDKKVLIASFIDDLISMNHIKILITMNHPE